MSNKQIVLNTYICLSNLKIRPQGNGQYMWHQISINKGDRVTFISASNLPKSKDLFWIDTINGEDVDNLLVDKKYINKNFEDSNE